MSVERLSWAAFLSGFRWDQGEHVSIIGPTGTGKSYLARQLLPFRRYAVVMGNKRRDATLSDLMARDGFTRVDTWPPVVPWWKAKPPEGWANRVALWPHWKGGTHHMRGVLADQFAACYDDVLARGGYTIDVDEAWYQCKILGLTAYLEELWTGGRSGYASLLAQTQRPAWVPLFMYDAATHLFLFCDNDEANLKRIGGLGGLSSRLVRETVAGLPPHSVLYVNTRTHRLAVTRVSAPTE